MKADLTAICVWEKVGGQDSRVLCCQRVVPGWSSLESGWTHHVWVFRLIENADVVDLEVQEPVSVEAARREGARDRAEGSRDARSARFHTAT